MSGGVCRFFLHSLLVNKREGGGDWEVELLGNAGLSGGREG